MNKKQKGGIKKGITVPYTGKLEFKESKERKYKKRQLKKSARLTKKAEKQEKKADEAKAVTKKQYGTKEGSLFAFQPSGKRSRRRAKRAADKAQAGSRKAYKKGKKAGIYKTGGFLEPPTEEI